MQPSLCFVTLLVVHSYGNDKLFLIIASQYYKTSGQSNLTRGRIAAAHGRFSGIRQVALECIPANTWFLGPTGVQIPNGISIGSAVFERSLLWQTDRPRYSVCNSRPHVRT